MRMLPAIRLYRCFTIKPGLACIGRCKMLPLPGIRKRAILLLLLLISVPVTQRLHAQVVDRATNIELKHSPHRATIYSAVLPGLGQVYNGKYWKVPIIYAGFGIMYYITKENTLEYRKFREAFRYVATNDTLPINNEYVNRYNEQQLRQGMNLYRRNTEIGYIISGVWYILNIIDASVDAHLFYYDISENLSLKLEPAVLNDPLAARPVNGISLTMRF